MICKVRIFRPATQSTLTLDFPGLPTHDDRFLLEFVKTSLYVFGFSQTGWELVSVHREMSV